MVVLAPYLSSVQESVKQEQEGALTEDTPGILHESETKPEIGFDYLYLKLSCPWRLLCSPFFPTWMTFMEDAGSLAQTHQVLIGLITIPVWEGARCEWGCFWGSSSSPSTNASDLGILQQADMAG